MSSGGSWHNTGRGNYYNGKMLGFHIVPVAVNAPGREIAWVLAIPHISGMYFVGDGDLNDAIAQSAADLWLSR